MFERLKNVCHGLRQRAIRTKKDSISRMDMNMLDGVPVKAVIKPGHDSSGFVCAICR